MVNYYQNVCIYYFSGTGNAQAAARWIKASAEAKGIQTQMQAIEKVSSPQAIAPNGRSLYVFAYPTHGFCVIWIMLKFMWRFPRIQGGDVLFLNTRGGVKIWKFYFPGLSGLALWLPMLMFRTKGYTIKGALPLDMPHSWTSFFPPNLQRFSEQITRRCQGIVENMCQKIFAGNKYFRFTVWVHVWADIAVSWIVPLYLLTGRFFLAKTLFPSYQCNNCRLCERCCPVNAITIQNNRPYWKIHCESCMRCMNICPKKAIQSWVSRMGIAGYFLFTAGITCLNTDNMMIMLLVSLLLFPLYWILLKLLRIKLVNVLFTYTSLTRYWRRYKVPVLNK